MAANAQFRMHPDVHFLSAVSFITPLKAVNRLLDVDVHIHNRLCEALRVHENVILVDYATATQVVTVRSPRLRTRAERTKMSVLKLYLAYLAVLMQTRQVFLY